jgi:N-acetylmuramoyl-L-alanine amidase
MHQITENFLTLGGKNRPGSHLVDVRSVVLHWLAAPNQRPINTRAWFEQGAVFGSTQYIIGTAGDIMRVMPENEVAWHVGTTQNDPASGRRYTDEARRLFTEAVCNAGRPNFHSIGIELSHLDNEPGTFTEETLTACAWLCADILARHGKDESILSHHQRIVGWKDCPRFFVRFPDRFEEYRRRIGTELKRMRPPVVARLGDLR